MPLDWKFLLVSSMSKPRAGHVLLTHLNINGNAFIGLIFAVKVAIHCNQRITPAALVIFILGGSDYKSDLPRACSIISALNFCNRDTISYTYE